MPAVACWFVAEFKLAVLRRMNDEGLSSRQAAVLFDLRRFDLAAEWSRLYADHGMAALQPGWNGIRARMKKTPIRRDDATAPGDDPYAYFKDILERVPTHPASRIDDLLPHRWSAATAR